MLKRHHCRNKPGVLSTKRRSSLEALESRALLAGDFCGAGGDQVSALALEALLAAGDFNGDRQLDVVDLDLLRDAVDAELYDPRFDVVRDEQLNVADEQFWLHSIRRSPLGDSNFDGEFSSTDLVVVFQTGKYEDSLPLNATWADGDWNGDKDFSSSDLVSAFQEGRFEAGPLPLGVESLQLAEDDQADGDPHIATNSSVDLVGLATPYSIVELPRFGLVTHADSSGEFTFREIPLSLGANSIEVLVHDVNCNTIAHHTMLMTEIPDQYMPVDQDEMVVEVAPADADFDQVTYLVRATVQNPLAEIRDKYGLRFAGDYYTNLTGLDEKWLTSEEGNAYFLLPNGDLVRMGNTLQQTSAAESLVAQLDETVYEDPSLLWDAVAEFPADALTWMDQGELHIDPLDGVFGKLQITVAASDGRASRAQDFNLYVRPQRELYEEEREIVDEVFGRAESLTLEEIPAFVEELGELINTLSGRAVAQVSDLIRTLLMQVDDTELRIRMSDEWRAEQERLIGLEMERATRIQFELDILQNEYASAWADIKPTLAAATDPDPFNLPPPLFINGTQIGPFEVEQGRELRVDLRAIHPLGLPEHDILSIESPDGSFNTAQINRDTGVLRWTPGDHNALGFYTFEVEALVDAGGTLISAEVEFDVHVLPAVKPTVDELVVAPGIITDSGTDEVVLTALGVAHPTDLVDSVRFWQDLNGNQQFEFGIDHLLGVDSFGANGWSVKATPRVEPGDEQLVVWAEARRLSGVSDPQQTTIDVIPAAQFESNLVEPLAEQLPAKSRFGTRIRRTFGNGEAVVVWYENRWNGPVVRGQWYRHDGDIWRDASNEVYLQRFRRGTIVDFDAAVDAAGNVLVAVAINESGWDSVQSFMIKRPSRFQSQVTSTYFSDDDFCEEDNDTGDLLCRNGDFQVTAALNDHGFGMVAWEYEYPELEPSSGLVFRWPSEDPPSRLSGSEVRFSKPDSLPHWYVGLENAGLSSMNNDGKVAILWPGSGNSPTHIGLGQLDANGNLAGGLQIQPVELGVSWQPTHLAIDDQGWLAVGGGDEFVVVTPSLYKVGESSYYVLGGPSRDGLDEISEMYFDEDGVLHIVHEHRAFPSSIHGHRQFTINGLDGVYPVRVEIEAVDEFVSNEPFDVSFAVQNDSASTAQAFDVVFYLSHDLNISAVDRILGSHRIDVLAAGQTSVTQTIELTMPDNPDPFWAQGTTDLYLIAAVPNSGASQQFAIDYVKTQPITVPIGGNGFNPSPAGGKYIRPLIALQQVEDPSLVNAYDSMELIGRQMVSALESLRAEAPPQMAVQIDTLAKQVELGLDGYFHDKWTAAIAARNEALAAASTSRLEAEGQLTSEINWKISRQENIRNENNAVLDRLARNQSAKLEDAAGDYNATVSTENAKVAAAEQALAEFEQAENGLALLGAGSQFTDGLGSAAGEWADDVIGCSNLEECREVAEDNLEAAKDALLKARDNARRYAEEKIAAAYEKYEETKEEINDYYEVLMAPVREIIEAATTEIGNLTEGLATALQSIEGAFNSAVTSATTLFADELDGVKLDAVPIFDQATDKLTDMMATVTSPDLGILAELGDQLANLESLNPIGSLSDIKTLASSQSASILSQAWGELQEQLAPAVDSVIAAGGEFADWAEGLGVSDWVESAGGKATTWTKQCVSDLFGCAADTFGEIGVILFGGPRDPRGISKIDDLWMNHGYTTHQAHIVYQLVFKEEYEQRPNGLEGRYREEFEEILSDITQARIQAWLLQAPESRESLNVVQSLALPIATEQFLARYGLNSNGSRRAGSLNLMVDANSGGFLLSSDVDDLLHGEVDEDGKYKINDVEFGEVDPAYHDRQDELRVDEGNPAVYDPTTGEVVGHFDWDAYLEYVNKINECRNDPSKCGTEKPPANVDNSGVLYDDQNNIIGTTGAISEGVLAEKQRIAHTFPETLSQSTSQIDTKFKQSDEWQGMKDVYNGVVDVLSLGDDFLTGFGSGVAGAVTDLATGIAAFAKYETWEAIGNAVHKTASEFMDADDKAKFVADYGIEAYESFEKSAFDFLLEWENASGEERANLLGSLAGRVATDAVLGGIAGKVVKSIPVATKLKNALDRVELDIPGIDQIPGLRGVALTQMQKKLVVNGMHPRHADGLAGFAKNQNSLVVVRSSKIQSLKWQGQPGYLPKPEGVKFKVDADSGIVKGRVADDGSFLTLDGKPHVGPDGTPGNYRVGESVGGKRRIYKDNKPMDYFVEADGSVVDAAGNRFHSDYDLLGVYEPPSTHPNAWVSRPTGATGEPTSPLVRDINASMDGDVDMVQHAANDEFWEKLKESGTVNGYQKAYESGERFIVADTDGSIRVLDVVELKKLYRSRCIPWPTDDGNSLPRRCR